MRIPTSMLVTAVAVALSSSAVAVSAQKADAVSSHEAFGGIWVNTPDSENSRPAAPLAAPEPGFGGRRGGGTGGGGGRGGGGGGGGVGGPGGGIGGPGGGFGGGGSSGGGFGAGRRRPDGNELAAQAAALAVFTRELTDPVGQMTVVVKETMVSIATGDGQVTELRTNNKKVSGTAENGFVKFNRTSRWDGPALVSEIAVKDGPTFEQRYEVTVDGRELHVSTRRKAAKASTSRGGFGGSSTFAPTVHAYGHPGSETRDEARPDELPPQ